MSAATVGLILVLSGVVVTGIGLLMIFVGWLISP